MRSIHVLAAAALASAGITQPALGQIGLLVVAHGADSSWNAGVRTLVDQVRWADGPVACAFLMGPEATISGWDAGVARLLRAQAREIIVIPLMVSSRGAHVDQIRFYAGEIANLPAGLEQHDHGHRTPPVPTHVTSALDDAPELGEALVEHWRSLSPLDRARPIVLVAHGPTTDTDAAFWVRNLDAAAARLRDEGGIRVGIGLLRDDAPVPIRAAAVDSLRATITALARESGDSVAVLPVLVSHGAIDQVKIPADLAGLPVRYTAVALAALTPIARWIERIALAKAVTVR